jgi:hypothetical protein
MMNKGDVLCVLTLTGASGGTTTFRYTQEIENQEWVIDQSFVKSNFVVYVIFGAKDEVDWKKSYDFHYFFRRSPGSKFKVLVIPK